MGAQMYLSQFFLRDGEARFINRGVQIGLATKASGRGGRADEIEHGFVTVQGVSGPVSTNQVEHAMLNQVPFRGPRWIMGHRDNQPKLIGQPLQANFPQPSSVTIGTTPIRLDQQVSFPRIKNTSQFQPPSSDRGHGKLGGIMRRAHDDITLVMAEVIDAIGDGFALGRTQKVVDIDLASLLPPFHPGLLKVADQLALFGIDTDGWPMAALISLSPANKVTKLLVTVGRLLSCHPFVVDPQRIISCLQQTTNRRQTDRMYRHQGLLDFAQRLVRPFQSRNRVTRRLLNQQRFQSRQQPRRFFSTRGRPPPLALIRSLKSLAFSSPWPRLIVVRLKPVTWAMVVTPP